MTSSNLYFITESVINANLVFGQGAYVPRNNLIFCNELPLNSDLIFTECETVQETPNFDITIDGIYNFNQVFYSSFSLKYITPYWRGVTSKSKCNHAQKNLSKKYIINNINGIKIACKKQLIHLNGKNLFLRKELPHLEFKKRVTHKSELRHYLTGDLDKKITDYIIKVIKTHKKITNIIAKKKIKDKTNKIDFNFTIKTNKKSDILETNNIFVFSYEKDLLNTFTKKTHNVESLIHTHGKPLTPGVREWIPDLYIPEIKPKYTPTKNLIFICNQSVDANLIFGQPYCKVYTVPIRKYYFMENSFSMVRVDNSTPILATSFNMNIDVDSWAWAWSANVPGRQIDDVLTFDIDNPIEILVTINTIEFKLLIEKISKNRQFGKDSISLSGRGLSAYLGSPYSPVLSLYSSPSITALQGAQEALKINNIPIGWSIDWQIDDWLIASGALSNTGLHIDHLQYIADAGGGYLLPHNTLETISILPYYPVKPWELSTAIPDISLNETSIVSENIEYISKPYYNGVYIHGNANGGRLDFIRRNGTAGDWVAPTVVNALATDSIMTQQRGLRILGDTGKIRKFTISLPVFNETGIIKPGKIIKYVIGSNEYIGISRSVSINYSMPTLRQSIEIETHEYI